MNQNQAPNCYPLLPDLRNIVTLALGMDWEEGLLLQFLSIYYLLKNNPFTNSRKNYSCF